MQEGAGDDAGAEAGVGDTIAKCVSIETGQNVVPANAFPRDGAQDRKGPARLTGKPKSKAAEAGHESQFHFRSLCWVWVLAR